jgi:hypothetical protein
MTVSEIESREFGEFRNQPKGLQFRLLSTDGNAGVYKQGDSIAVALPVDFAKS